MDTAGKQGFDTDYKKLSLGKGGTLAYYTPKTVTLFIPLSHAAFSSDLTHGWRNVHKVPATAQA